jgi:hypothetical protein
MRRATLSGFFVVVTALLTWWGCNAFIPLLGSTLAHEQAQRAGLAAPAARLLAAAWQARACNAFNLGGLDRRRMFVVYFLFSAAALLVTFGTALEPRMRLDMLLAVGAGVYGIFAARPRATGAGFCYNIGRIFAAGGPFVVGALSAAAGGSSAAIVRILLWFALVPLAAALIARFVIVETRGRTLPA